MNKPFRCPIILAAIELGSPAADCAHFGICSVEVLAPAQYAIFQPKHIRHVKAALSRTRAGLLRIEFPYDGMRLETRQQYFPRDGFRVDSAKALPNWISEVLGLASGSCTRPGAYALVLAVDGYVVELVLVKEEYKRAGGI